MSTCVKNKPSIPDSLIARRQTVVVDLFSRRGELNFRSMTCCTRATPPTWNSIKVLPGNPRPWISERSIIIKLAFKAIRGDKQRQCTTDALAFDILTDNKTKRYNFTGWEKETKRNLKRERERERNDNYNYFLRKFIN